jgi:hypothetical protein
MRLHAKLRVAFVASCVLSTSLASAQIPVNGDRRLTATVTTNGPIYLSAPPTAGVPPLRTAASGTLLKVLGEKDDWLQVEFNDPQYGPRLGWIQKKFVVVDDPALRPMDLSVPKETVKPPAASAVAKPTTPSGAPPSPERAIQAPAPTSTAPAISQSAPSAPPKSNTSGAWIDVNFIAVNPAQKAQAYVRTEIIHSETATGASAYPELPTAYGAGIDGGYQFENGVGFGIHWMPAKYDYTVGLAIKIPHPNFFNAYATDADVTAGTLTRKDNAVDISITYVPRTPDKLRIRLFGGPTYFSVSQEMVSNIFFNQSFGIFNTSNVVTITEYDQETAEGSTWGFHGGVDVSYFFARHVGVGGVVRVNGGSVDIDEPLSEEKATLKLGGVLLGVGIRFRF